MGFMPTPAWRIANADKARKHRRDYYERNKTTEIASAQRNREAYRARNTAIVVEAKSVPCTDCGVQYPPYVMQFDHTGTDKVANVSRLVNVPVSESVLRAEIAKCEVVCANCHAERTHGKRRSGPLDR